MCSAVRAWYTQLAQIHKIQHRNTALWNTQNNTDTQSQVLCDLWVTVIVWQRFCEPSPDLGFRLSVHVCVCVCLDQNRTLGASSSASATSSVLPHSWTIKPIPSSFQPKTVNQTFPGPKSTCSARHCRLQVCSFNKEVEINDVIWVHVDNFLSTCSPSVLLSLDLNAG